MRRIVFLFPLIGQWGDPKVLDYAVHASLGGYETIFVVMIFIINLMKILVFKALFY